MDIKKLKLFNRQSIIYFALLIMGSLTLASFGVVFKYLTNAIALKENLTIPIITFTALSFTTLSLLIMEKIWEEKTKYRFELMFKQAYLTSTSKIKYQMYDKKKIENELLYDSKNIITKYMLGKLRLYAGIIRLVAISITIGYLSPLILPVAMIVNLIIVLLVNKLKVKASLLQETISYNRETFLKESSNIIAGYEDMASFSSLNKLPLLFQNANTKYYRQQKMLVLISSFLSFAMLSLPIGSNLLLSLTIFGFSHWNLITISSIIAFFGSNTILNGTLTIIRNQISAINSMQKINFKFAKNHASFSIKNKINLFPIKLHQVQAKIKNHTLIYPEILIKQTKKYYVTGANGSGKSIMMKIISGIFPHYSGQVTYGDKFLNELETSHKIIYLEPKPLIFPGKIKDNIDINHIPPPFKELATNVLPDFNHQAQTLSLGQKQIIALIRAFQFKKEMIILDEALAGVSSQNTIIIENILNKSSTTIVYISHNKKTQFKYDQKIKL